MKAVRAAPFLCHARMHPLYPLQLGARLERIETRGHVFHPSGQSRAVHGAVVSAVHGAAAARARAGATEAFTFP